MQSVTKPSPDKENGAIRAVTRVCEILDLLQDAPDGLLATEIAELAHLPKSTAYRYLVSLERRAYIARDEPTNIVRLGSVFRPKATRDLDRFISQARPILAALRDETGETTNLGVLDGGQYVHSAVAESRQIIRLAAREGERCALHSTAIGKVIAAELPDDTVREILRAEGMPRFTDRTILTVDAFLRELPRVRAKGYALDDCENQEAGRCIAVSVPGAPALSGLSISSPASRFPKSRVPTFVAALKNAAATIGEQGSRELESAAPEGT